MKHKMIGCLCIAMIWALIGCGTVEQQVVTVIRPSYEKITYQTAEVLRGDLNANMTLKLMTEGFEEILYHAPDEKFELEEVHISVGDRVKKGDILVSFVSEDIRKKIAEYEAEMTQNELLIQHYTNLMEVDKNADYGLDIEMLREDNQIAQLYIEEAGGLLAEYQIVAKADGIVTEVSEYLQNDVITPGVELVTQVTGTGRYLATTSDVEFFAIGDSYSVSADGIEYELCLAEVSGETLIFKPSLEPSILSPNEAYELKLEMPKQEDVVYVNRHALCNVRGEEDCYYVYVMEESGYQRAVFVTPGERVGEHIIIADGLDGGEKVVIR